MSSSNVTWEPTGGWEDIRDETAVVAEGTQRRRGSSTPQQTPDFTPFPRRP